MIKKLSIFMILILFLSGCSGNPFKDMEKGIDVYEETGVSIVNKGKYYDVVIDLDCGLSRMEIGRNYGIGILKVVPEYEALVDSYLQEYMRDDQYEEYILRVQDIKPQIKEEYREEIEGIASVFSGGNENVLGDGKISCDEVYMFNLLPDISNSVQCSVVAVFGERSETGGTMIARNLDWLNGKYNQASYFQSVITYKQNNKMICSIGYLGYIGIITGINNDGIFTAILVGSTGAQYNSINKYSYTIDLRYALENCSGIYEIADYMKDSSRNYVDHIIAIADSNSCIILENNTSGSRASNSQRPKREIREWDSVLRDNVTWGISDAIASVNSFLLDGTYDNHTRGSLNKKRWENLKKQLKSKGDKVTFEELKQVISYDAGTPGTMSDSGDLYNKMTQQSIVFRPEDFYLEIYFHPKEQRDVPKNPTFEKVEIFNTTEK